MITRVFYLICLLTIISGVSAAQEIHGDTIYVNDQLVVTLAFPADIFQAQLVDAQAPYRVTTAKNAVQVKANAKDTKCSNAVIDEGKRSHVVVFCFKSGLKSDVDDYFDLSNMKLLQKYIKEKEERHRANAVAKVNASSEKKDETAAKEKKAQLESVLKEGKQAVKNEDYVTAKIKFQIALQSDPSNSTAQNGLSEVEKVLKERTDKAIKQHKELASTAEASKDYTRAIKEYKEVLALSPYDNYSEGKIASLEELMAAEVQNTKKTEEATTLIEKEKKIYYLKTYASKSFNEKNYNAALMGYKSVLVLNPFDSFSKNKVDELQKIVDDQEAKQKKTPVKKRSNS
jgi:tetratricopeptide (TPR) repeat protein